MNIELKVIDKDTLKVGDLVGVGRNVSCGWGSSFRHQLITPAQITRITPKRTKFFTDKFGEHDKNEIFYEYDENARKESSFAIMFEQFKRGEYELEEFRRKYGLDTIEDGDVSFLSDYITEIMNILKKYSK